MFFQLYFCIKSHMNTIVRSLKKNFCLCNRFLVILSTLLTTYRLRSRLIWHNLVFTIFFLIFLSESNKSMDNLKNQYAQLLEDTNQRLANESTLSKWYCY